MSVNYNLAGAPGGGGTPIHYLYGYVPPNGVVILTLLIYNRESISEAFSRTGFNISNVRNLQFCKQPLDFFYSRTDSQFGVPDDTYPPKKYPSAPPPPRGAGAWNVRNPSALNSSSVKIASNSHLRCLPQMF